jgi:hypothetical protein
MSRRTAALWAATAIPARLPGHPQEVAGEIGASCPANLILFSPLEKELRIEAVYAKGFLQHG